MMRNGQLYCARGQVRWVSVGAQGQSKNSVGAQGQSMNSVGAQSQMRTLLEPRGEEENELH